MPFDRRAVTSRFHVELAGVEPYAAPQILERRNDVRMAGGAGVFGVMQVRRLDPPHPGLGCRMRVFEIVDVVIGGNGVRALDKAVGDAAQRLDLGDREDVGNNDNPSRR